MLHSSRLKVMGYRLWGQQSCGLMQQSCGLWVMGAAELRVIGYGGSRAAGYGLMRYARLKVRGYGLKVMGAVKD